VTGRRAQTRDRLLDAAMEVFAEQGVGGATVEEICERAGFTRGAFYSNFESKDDLCVAAGRRSLDEAVEAINVALTTALQDLSCDAALTDVLDVALAIALNETIAAPARVLAHIEIRLHFLRNPELGMRATDLSDVDQVLGGIIADVLKANGFTSVLPVTQVIDLMSCMLQSHTMAGDDLDTIRREMSQILAVLIVPDPEYPRGDCGWDKK
jgi:AcrR family transcriptional regulator